MKTMRAEQCRGKGQRAGVGAQFSSWPSSPRSTKTSVCRVSPRHQRVRTSPACILAWVRRGWSSGPGPGAWASARSGSRRLARGDPPLKSLVSPATGSDYVAAVVVPLPQRLERGVDARIYVDKALSWWPCLIVERLSGVADAHSMEAQRNRPLDKGGRSCLRL